MRKLAAVVVTLFSVCTSIAADRPQYWDGAFKGVYDQLQKNLRPPGHDNPFWHVHPAPKYPGVYLWDSSFISLIWKTKNPAIAQDVIRSVLHNQQPDGRIPQVVSIMGPSPISNPPVTGWAANDILEKTHDTKFAAEAYPKLRAFHQWMWGHRRLPNGLFFWQRAYESGIDNSPRFGNRDESHYVDSTKIGAVDLTSYIAMDARALTSIANLLLSSKENVNRAALQNDLKMYQDQIEVTVAAINHYLWDEQSGLYYDYNMTTHSINKIATVASFFPMMAHAASHDQYLRLREHAMNPKEFNTTFPFPTVSRADPTFEKDVWRGPIWVNTSFLAIRGFREYGDQEAVKYFSERLVDAVYRTWATTGQFWEYYDPDRYDIKELTRKRGLGPHLFGPYYLSASRNPIKVVSQFVLKQLILGTKPVDHFVGWTGLVNTLAVEELGYDPVNSK